jgi:hypothetical protein
MARRIQWSEIYAYFTANENITLRDCADKYGLNYDSLRQKASKEGWTWRKQQVQRNALVLMDNRTSEEIAKRNKKQIEFAQTLLAKAAQALSEGIAPQNAKEIREWIETGIKIERICLELNVENLAKI